MDNYNEYNFDLKGKKHLYQGMQSWGMSLRAKFAALIKHSGPRAGQHLCIENIGGWECWFIIMGENKFIEWKVGKLVLKIQKKTIVSYFSYVGINISNINSFVKRLNVSLRQISLPEGAENLISLMLGDVLATTIH